MPRASVTVERIADRVMYVFDDCKPGTSELTDDKVAVQWFLDSIRDAAVRQGDNEKYDRIVYRDKIGKYHEIIFDADGKFVRFAEHHGLPT